MGQRGWEMSSHRQEQHASRLSSFALFPLLASMLWIKRVFNTRSPLSLRRHVFWSHSSLRPPHLSSSPSPSGQTSSAGCPACHRGGWACQGANSLPRAAPQTAPRDVAARSSGQPAVAPSPQRRIPPCCRPSARVSERHEGTGSAESHA